MQIPILNGITTDNKGNFRNSFPKNLVPVAGQNGIADGYLRPAPGIVYLGTGPGIDRGGINWNGVYYRVMGSKLVSIDQTGAYTEIGDVGAGDQVTIVYSFDYLAVASNNDLFLYDGSTLTQVTDTDLGTVLDLIWIDGYFMTTDGEFLVVTELNNPFSVNPLKYGSSEADPDPIKSLKTIRNEAYAANRYTVEVFDNVGGDGFPFRRIEGAQIEKGTIGKHTTTVFMEHLVFLGSGRNEALAVYMAQNGTTIKLSDREIDLQLKEYTEAELSLVILESKVSDNHNHLLIKLPDQTLVYDATASIKVKEPVWFVLHSGLEQIEEYRAQNFIRCYDKWLVADPQSAQHGYLVDDIGSHYGIEISTEFGTTIIYNKGKGLIINSLELVALTGNVALNADPTIWTQYSLDGRTWSQPKGIKSGKQGDRKKRLVWIQQAGMRNFRMQRFKGTSESHLTYTRLELEVETLYV